MLKSRFAWDGLSGELCINDGSGTDRWLFLDDPVVTLQAVDLAKRALGLGRFHSVT
tara:strand:- start:114 stop:281 length:168 start_codon:yes stop_codon:yes gene_type:complete